MFIERIVERSGIDAPEAREDLRRELRAHFEDAGASPEAMRAAMTRFGGAHAIAEALRQAVPSLRGGEAPSAAVVSSAELLQICGSAATDAGASRSRCRALPRGRHRRDRGGVQLDRESCCVPFPACGKVKTASSPS
jgi:hypothetical protein